MSTPSTSSTQSTSSTLSAVALTRPQPTQPATTPQPRSTTRAFFPTAHFCLLLLLPGCLSRGDPPDFDFEEVVVTDDELSCRPILAGSPGQVMAFYKTKIIDGTAAVTIYVKPRRHGRMGDDFHILRIPLTPDIHRVILTNGVVVNEIWRRDPRDGVRLTAEGVRHPGCS